MATDKKRKLSLIELKVKGSTIKRLKTSPCDDSVTRTVSDTYTSTEKKNEITSSHSDLSYELLSTKVPIPLEKLICAIEERNNQNLALISTKNTNGTANECTIENKNDSFIGLLQQCRRAARFVCSGEEEAGLFIYSVSVDIISFG
jgi:hypothetical protein